MSSGPSPKAYSVASLYDGLILVGFAGGRRGDDLLVAALVVSDVVAFDDRADVSLSAMGALGPSTGLEEIVSALEGHVGGLRLWKRLAFTNSDEVVLHCGKGHGRLTKKK